MNKDISFLFWLFLFYQQISTARSLSIGMPLANTIVFAGARTLVTWSGVPNTISSLSISLASGQSETSMTPVASFASGLSTSSSSLWVTVPKNTTSGSNYYIVIVGNDNPPSMATTPVHVAFGTSPTTSSAGNTTSITPTALPSSSASVTSNATSIISSKPASSATSSKITPAQSNNVQSSSPTSSATPNTEVHNDVASSNGVSSQQVAGAVVGSVAGAAIAGAGLIFWMRRRRPYQDKHQDIFSQGEMIQDHHDPGTYRRGFGVDPVMPAASYAPYEHSQHSHEYLQTPYQNHAHGNWAPAPMQAPHQWQGGDTIVSNASTANTDKPHARH